MTDGMAHYPDLVGRVVLVTGGADGIGRAIAEAFAAQRARVVVLDKARDMLATLEARLPGLTGRCIDLTDVPATIAAIEAVEAETGGIDVLVNNAGHDERHAFTAVTAGYWDERMAVNLRHVMFATQTTARHMQRRKAGVVLTLGSTSWMKSAPGMVAYTTAKAAILGFTKTVARELGPDGIRVNCIVPGWVLTERQLAENATPEKLAAAQREQALKIRIAPQDIAAAALFLASDAARAITGQCLVVDAGTV